MIAIAPVDHLPLVDPQALTILGHEAGSEMVPRLVAVFLAECDKRRRMLADCPTDDPETAARTVAWHAHALKSAAASYGCLRLAELARRLDAAFKRHEQTRVIAAVPLLIATLAETEADLAARLEMESGTAGPRLASRG